MGVTISHELAQKKLCVKNTLDNTQKIADEIKVKQAELVGVKFEIRRLSDYELLINIGNCETLAFNFKSVKEINEQTKDDYVGYDYAVLTNDGKKKLNEGYLIKEYPQNEIWYCASFCKTQFSESLVEHKWVADLIRTVAAHCVKAEVNDEGDYYHSGILGDAEKAIEENGILIDSISNQLVGTGYGIVKGGSTKIKSHKKK